MHAEEDARMYDERERGDWQRCPIHALFISSDIHALNARVVKRERAKNFHVLKKVETLESIPGQRKKAELQNGAEKVRLIVNQREICSKRSWECAIQKEGKLAHKSLKDPRKKTMNTRGTAKRGKKSDDRVTATHGLFKSRDGHT